MKACFAIICFFIIGWHVQAQPCQSLRYQDTIFHQVTTTSGIYFGTATPYGLLAQPQDLYLDFYEPAGDTLVQRPLIVFQFGGGFVIGWRSEPDIPQFCTYFAKCGYAVASIDYRIGLNAADTNSTIRAYYRGVQDERAAIRFLCQRAGQFRIDTSTIILTGTSAGCFCALANAFTTDTNRPVSSFGSTLEPDDLGCMDCSGNVDFGQHIPRIKAIINQWGAILDTTYMEPTENTPVISFHGDQDALVPYVYGYPFQLPVFPNVYGSVPIHERLTNLGITNELHPLLGYGHEPELLAPNLNDTIYRYSRIFLYQLLKPHTGPLSGPAAVCKSQSAVYTVPYTNGSSYCWQLHGNGTVLQNNSNSITVLWNNTGTMSVSVKELNALQAEGDTISFETQVLPDVSANFGYLADELTVTLSNWSVHATNYHWLFGNGSTSTDESPSVSYTSGGTYPITLIADNGTCADTFSTTLTVDSCPVAEFTYAVTNHNGFFYAQPTNTTAYTWFFGDGDSSSVSYPNVIHVYPTDGTYNVVLRVKNELQCTAADTTTIHLVTTGLSSTDTHVLDIRQPETNRVVVATATGQPVHAELTDAAGKTITTQTSTSGLITMWLEALPPGVYLLRVTCAHQIEVRKIFVH